MRVRTQLALALAALVGFTAALLVAINYLEARDLLYRQIQSEVLSIAATAARTVDAAALAKIQAPADATRPEFAALQAQLRALRDANRRPDVHVRFLYTMRPAADGCWRYVVDAEEPGGDFSAPGAEVKFDGREPLHLDVPYVEKNFSADEFGVWLSANAPVRDAAGRPVALLGVDLDAREVTARLRRLLLEGLGAGLIALAAAVAGGLLIARWFTAPLEKISVAVARIGAGELDARAAVARRDEFGALAEAVNRMGVALRERDALKGALARYVSREIADEVLAGQGVPVLRGARREVTVLIVDIRGFTAMSARLEPEEVVRFLNAFFTRLIEIIFAHRGTLDKFLGDGCLAMFGAPLDDEHHQRNAVRAARAMLAAVPGLGAELRARHGIELRIGIGLHTGGAIVGNIGSDERMEYTAIGDTVNVASRLEAMNKEFGTRLLASEAVVRGAGDEFPFVEVRDVVPRGSEKALKVFTLADAE